MPTTESLTPSPRGADLPLRPWPAICQKPLEPAPKVHAKAVRTDWCFAWCGFYIGVARYWWRA